MLIELDRYWKIPSDLFDICLVDGVPYSDIAAIYPRRGGSNVYKVQKFQSYLKDTHGLSIKDYCIHNLAIKWPQYLDKQEDARHLSLGRGSGVLIRKYSKDDCETNEAFKKHAQHM